MVKHKSEFTHLLSMLFLLWGLSAPVYSDDCVKIRQIKINALDVYEDDENPNFVEKTINFLNFTTRDHVIEQELLFVKDECLDHELVEESARNLRALPIFSDATIRVEPLPEPGWVDVVVTTKDRFTFRGEISLSRKAGANSGRISLGDKNLLGLNKEILINHLADENDDETEFVFRDPRFFHDYLLYTVYNKADDGVRQVYDIRKPFRSFDDKLSYSFIYNKNEQNFNYSIDGGYTIDIPQFYERQGLSYLRELGDRKESKRVGATLSLAHHEFFPGNITLDQEIPDRLKRIDVDVSGILTFREDFIELQGLDSLIYREDIALGKSLNVSVGVQRREENNQISHHQKYRASFSQTAFMSREFLSSYYLSHYVRLYAGDLMAANSTAFYHGYYMPTPGHVFLGGVTYQYRHSKDSLDSPVTMGGGVGLRGLKAGTFTGNKSLLFNIEYRHRLPFDWQKVALGQVFFVDAGYAWKHGTNIDLEDVQPNIGYGIRLDIPSLFGRDVMRFDIAYDIETKDYLTSVIFGQVFDYNDLAD